MINMYIEKSTISNIVEAIKQLDMEEDTVVLVAIADKNTPDIKELIRRLNQSHVAFIGGIFPGVIDGTNCYEEGTKLFVLLIIEQPLLLKNISQKTLQLPEWINSMGNADKKYTAMIIIDGFSSNISGFLANVFDQLGSSVSYIGGGGRLQRKAVPLYIHTRGIFSGCSNDCSC